MEQEPLMYGDEEPARVGIDINARFFIKPKNPMAE